MPAHATNKTNLASVKSDIATLKSNAKLGTGDAPAELNRLCKELTGVIARYETTIQGIV